MVVLRSVKSAFIHFDRETFNTVYNTYIRPRLKYCVQVWSPYYAKYVFMLEKVQHRATKLVIGFKVFTYEERREKKREEWRLRGNLIETFKLLTGKENINPDKFFNINLNNLRGHSKKINKQQCFKLWLMPWLCRGELLGLAQFLNRTSAIYSILLYTVASSIDYVINQWHFG